MTTGAEIIQQFILDLCFERLTTGNKYFDRFLQSIVDALAQLTGQNREDVAQTEASSNSNTTARLKGIEMPYDRH